MIDHRKERLLALSHLRMLGLTLDDCIGEFTDESDVDGRINVRLSPNAGCELGVSSDGYSILCLSENRQFVFCGNWMCNEQAGFEYDDPSDAP